MEEKLITVACHGVDTLDIDQLLPFQGELKALPEESYKKLKSEIATEGFSFPFFVWRKVTRHPADMEIGEREVTVDYYLIDGHQRLRVLERMREDGWTVPKLPVVWIDAADRETAKRRVLAAAAQYGEMTAKSLADYMKDGGLNLSDVKGSFRFPEVEWKKLELQFNTAPESGERKPPPQGATEVDPNAMKFDHQCPRCGFQFNG